MAMLCALLVVLAGGRASAQAAPSVLNAKRFTLANGMTVLVMEDHTKPFVAMQLTFDVGSGDDPPHAPGTSAMFIELLKHASTRHVRVVDRYALIESFGAHPWETDVGGGDDKTWITALVPSHALELALFLESDRVGYFSDGIDLAEVTRARNVLKDRVGKSWTDSFRAVMYDALTEMYGPKHAYGSRWDAAALDGFTPSQLRVRARKRYAPNRLVLALAGDVEVARAKELAERYFATLARGESPSKRPAETPTKRLSFELTSKTREPGVFYGWRTAPYLTDPDYALDGLARVMRRRLIDRLVTPGIAKYIGSRQQSSSLSSAFVINAVPDDEHDVKEIVSVFESELESLRKSPISDAELRPAKDWLCLGIVDGNEELESRPGLATSFWYRVQDPNGYATYLARYRALDTKTLHRVMREQLGRPPDMIAIRRRGNEETDIPRRSQLPIPTDEGDADSVPKDEDVRLTPPEVQTPAPFRPPSVEEIQLTNGARALLHEGHDFPRIRVRVIVEFGLKPTLPAVWIAARLFVDTKLASKKTLRQALLDYGSELVVSSEQTTSYLTVSVLPEHFETVMALLVEAVTRGKPRASDIESMQKNHSPVAEHSLLSRTSTWADEFLFTAKSGLRTPYSKVDSNWKNVKLADIERMTSKLTAAQLTFAIEGDATPAETKRVLEAATRRLAKQKRQPPEPVRLNTGLFLIDDPQSENVGLRLSAQMPTWSDGDGAPSTAIRWFFGTNSSISLNLVDRFREAGVGRFDDDNVSLFRQQHFSMLTFQIQAPPPEIPKIVGALLQQMQRLREGRIPAAAVAQARRESQNSLRENLSNSSQVLAWLTTTAVHDEDAQLMAAAYRRSEMFGHDELVQVAKSRLVPEKLAFIVLGNVTPIRPELEKLGLPITYRKAAGP